MSQSSVDALDTDANVAPACCPDAKTIIIAE